MEGFELMVLIGTIIKSVTVISTVLIIVAAIKTYTMTKKEYNKLRKELIDDVMAKIVKQQNINTSKIKELEDKVSIANMRMGFKNE